MGDHVGRAELLAQRQRAPRPLGRGLVVAETEVDAAQLLVQAGGLGVVGVVTQRGAAALEVVERTLTLAGVPDGHADLALQLGRAPPLARALDQGQRPRPLLARLAQAAPRVGGITQLLQECGALAVVGGELERLTIVDGGVVVGEEAARPVAGQREVAQRLVGLRAA